jgi:nucleotide-binding universal stress UspA family protein
MESRPAMQGRDLLMAAALRDFHEARRKATLEDLKARLTGKSDDLLAYQDVRQFLRSGTMEHKGLQEIPLNAIVGSVGRYNDFTRSFLPRRESDRERWAQIKLKATYEGGLPPIEVYKVGEAYFVLDGNHRVSVVRQLGATHIQAIVTEVDTKVPLTADTQLDDLIIKARYAEFLDRTHLHQLRPHADLTVTAPGQYRWLEAEIEQHRALLAEQRGEEVSLEEAVASWYDELYWPVVRSMRELGILQDFPQRTEADLYVWVCRHQKDLERELGWDVRPEAAAVDLAEHHRPRLQRILVHLAERMLDAVVPPDLEPAPKPGQWRRTLAATRSEDRLFTDILVPVSGSELGWLALEQALVVAGREGSVLRGFHVVRSQAELEGDRAQQVREQFQGRCRQAGVPGSLVIEAGPVARSICQRARWTDLVVANLAYPPAAGVRKLASGFHAMIRQCTRPLLAVPKLSLMTRALVGYDGSLRAKEALFVAAYLAASWGTALTVGTVHENGRAGQATLDEAQAYLEAHGVQARYQLRSGAVAQSLLDMADDQGCDFIVMGGYGYSPVLEVVLGSALDRLLRESAHPLLICQ